MCIGEYIGPVSCRQGSGAGDQGGNGAEEWYSLSMKEVSIKDLKRHLSAILAEAASGADVLILRHNRPWARVTAARTAHVRVGARFGRGALRPLFRNATKGRSLEVLLDDRRGGREGK